MAVFREVDEKGLADWLSTRPQIIKDLVAKISPGRLYRLKSSGHRVFPYSYSEDGTITVVVSGEFNKLTFERCVFGVTPEDLEECDLPSPDEPVGAVLKKKEHVEEYIKFLKDQDSADN